MNSHYFGFKRHMFIITSMILWSCSVDHATSSDSRLTQCAGASSLESCRAVKTSTTNTETNPDTQANNILPLGGSLGTSGSLAGPATWSLQSANIAPDGRVLRLKFSIPKIPADYSMPDWKPGVLAGASIQLSSGATLDYLGSWATYADYPLPMVNNEAAQNVAALSPGLYWMAYTLVDSQGNESKVSPAIRLPIKKDTTYQSDYKATLGDIGGNTMPAGYSANVYVGQPDGDMSTMALYETIPSTTVGTAQTEFTHTTWLNPNKAFPGYKTLTWSVNYLITDPTKVVTLPQTGLTVTGSAGLIQDSVGNKTPEFTAASVTNMSLVDQDGFTSASLTSRAAAAIIYVSASNGSDTRTFTQAQNPATPVATPAKAFDLLATNGQVYKGAAIRLLRGDTWLNQSFGLNVMGYDQKHPFVLEDYWYNYSGSATDPGTRPILSVNTTNGGIMNSWNSVGGITNALVNNVVIRRLAFINTNPLGGGTGVYFTNAGDGLTVDDCFFQGFESNFGIQVVKDSQQFYNNVTLMRNIIVDSQAVCTTSSCPHTAGAFLSNVKDAIFSQNVLDANGHLNGLTGGDIFSHNVYFQYTNTPGIIWGNFFREGGSHGIQIRPGGVAAYNVFSSNAIAAFVGGAGGGFRKNYVEKSRNIFNADGTVNSNLGQGLAADAAHVAAGYGAQIGQLFEQNIVVNSVGSQPQAFNFVESPMTPTRELIFRNNTTYNSGSAFAISVYNDPAHPGVQIDMSKTSNSVVSQCNVQSGGSTSASGTSFNNAIFYGPPVATLAGWFKSDLNSYSTSGASAQVFQIDQTQTVFNFAGYKAATKLDANSTYGARSVHNGSADLGTFYASIGGTSTALDYVNLLRNRKPRVWMTNYRIEDMWGYFAAQYAPTTAAITGCDTQGAGLDLTPTPSPSQTVPSIPAIPAAIAPTAIIATSIEVAPVNGQPSGPSGAPISPVATVSFVGTDTTTHGAWKGVYGADGFKIFQDLSSGNTSIPAYASLTTTGYTAYTWAATLTSGNGANFTRALQKAGSTTERIAALWYTSTNYPLDVTLTDTNTHQIALYALDYDGGRALQVDVIDKATGTVMDTQTLSAYTTGTFLVWNVKSSVTFKISNAGSSNAGISGIFFH